MRRTAHAFREAQLALAVWFTRQRCELFTRALVGVMLVVFAAKYALGPPLRDMNGVLIGADFSAFWAGARLIALGHEASLYDFDAQRALVRALAPSLTSDLSPYINPPFFAAVLLPLAALPYRVALALWWLGGALLLGFVVHWLQRELAMQRDRSQPRALWLAIAFFPTLSCFASGQNSVLSLAALTLWIVNARRKREFWSGIALGCLLWKPQLVFGPVLILLTQRRWRALLGVALSAFVWLGVGMACAPNAMRTYQQLAPQLFDLLRDKGYPVWGLESLYGFAVLLADANAPQLAKPLGLAFTACGAVFIVWSWLRADWAPGTRAWDVRMAGSIALSLVVSPHLYLYDTTLLILPFALVLAHFRGTATHPLDAGPLLARSVLLYATLVASPYLCRAMQDTLQQFGLAAPVVQLSTCAIVWWAVTLLQLAGAKLEAAH